MAHEQSEQPDRTAGFADEKFCRPGDLMETGAGRRNDDLALQ